MGAPHRSRILTLLSEACEIEHSLVCSYLFAAFSLKRGQVDGLDWRHEQAVRNWAAQVYFVASQEMLHLAQAWNLLQAIGGTPYFGKPAFPQNKDYLPIGVDLSLEGYTVATLERFLQWERPAEVESRRASVPIVRRASDFPGPFQTVGDLYGAIAELVESSPERELFIGRPELQVGPELADFPELVRVVDRATALDAIRLIRSQGEGSERDREDCHFGVFSDLRDELEIAVAAGLEPAHRVLSNPSLGHVANGSRVIDPVARAAMRYFDDIYETMLRLLGWVFGPGDPAAEFTQCIARGAICAMPILVKPLGEQIAAMTSGIAARTAGAPFSPIRHVPLPADEVLARVLIEERLVELHLRTTDLLKQYASLRTTLAWLPDRLKAVTNVLRGRSITLSARTRA